VIQEGVIEVGTKVRIAITNPSCSQELELPAEVVRHVESSTAGPLAMEIRLLPPPELRAEAETFIEDVQVAEHSRRMGGITGPISEIGIENLLQMFGTCAPKGTLTLLRGDEEGAILFEQGMLRGARLRESYGRKALSRLLEWREGSFEFHARTDSDLYRGDPVPLDAAMLDALCLHDEGRQLGVKTVPDEATLSIDPAKLDAARSELGQTEEAIVDLATVGMTVAKVIDVIPEPDVEVRQAIHGLVVRGLIRLHT
jgi:hypothetical protein